MPEGPIETGARRRDSALTRAAILNAATRRFARQGYEHAGVREIAADAGVTAALVNRYFESKEGLFAEVIEEAFELRSYLGGDPATLATRLARLLVYGREDDPDEVRTPLLLLLRSATEPRAAEMLRVRLEKNNLQPLAEQLGGPDAGVRAALIIAQLTGFAIMDQTIRPQALAEADREQLVTYLSESLAVCIGRTTRPGRRKRT